MEFLKIQYLTASQKKEILSLWNNEYPVNLKHSSFASFENYLQNLKDQSHIILLNESQEIKGWYFDFIRENERWFAIILDKSVQGKGFGKMLLNLAKEKEAKLNGWVIDHDTDLKENGENYISPMGFYLKNGFSVETDNRLELNHISAVKICWTKE